MRCPEKPGVGNTVDPDVLFKHLMADVKSNHLSIKEDEWTRDFITCSARFKSEGFGFYTKTLPSLAQSLLEGIESGQLSPTPTFRRKRGTQLPRIFHGLWKQIFSDDGKVLQCPSTEAFNDLYQLLIFQKKVEISIASEHDLAQFLDRNDNPFVPSGWVANAILLNARKSMASLERFPTIGYLPRHGPGAVAGGEKREKKLVAFKGFRLLHNSFPYYSWFFASASLLLANLQDYPREWVDSGCSVVLTVPKDSKSRRVIAKEPKEYQYIQGAIASWLKDYLPRFSNGAIEFKDQSKNKLAAQRGMCTIDLSAASDCVTLSLVERIFPPEFLNSFIACRVPRFSIGDGSERVLNIFATMGSGLCFPILALSIYALIRGIQTTFGLPPEELHIYGDDICCSERLFPYIMKYFPMVGMIPNQKKCFSRGLFRESCGGEFFQNTDVTPVRLRSTGSRIEDIISLTATGNQLYRRFFNRASEYIFSCVGSRLHTTLPMCDERSSYLGRESRISGPVGKTRWNRRYQRYDVKGLSPIPHTYQVTGERWTQSVLSYRLVKPPDSESNSCEFTVRNSFQLRAGWYPAPSIIAS